MVAAFFFRLDKRRHIGHFKERSLILYLIEREQMLDLNYVRENLDKVRAALEARHFDLKALDAFAEADAERRRVIAESDQLNAQRNASSREIGSLMKEGKKEEAEARRA